MAKTRPNTSYKHIKSKEITGEAYALILGLSPDDITLQFLTDTFMATDKSEAKINTYDYIYFNEQKFRDLAHKEFNGGKHLIFDFKNSAELFSKASNKTTVGCYILNMFLFADITMRKNLPFYNGAWNKGLIEDINEDLAFLLLDKQITTAVYRDFLDRESWWLVLSNQYVPSFNIESLATLPEVIERRKQLLEENKVELANGNELVMMKIVEELLGVAKQVLERDKPRGYELFKAGNAQFGNHYRNMSVMRGVIPKSGDNSKFNLCQSTLTEGITIEEMHKFADLMVLGSFSRAVNTAEGGYYVKMFNAAFQHCALGPEGSDCNTKFTTPVLITKKNFKDYHLRYIVENKKLVLLDGSNMTKYYDQVVNMRTPRYCNHDQYCSKCAGEMYYRLGIKNIGLVASRIGSNLLNASLKFFHNVTVQKGSFDFNPNLVEIEMEELVPDKVKKA